MGIFVFIIHHSIGSVKCKNEEYFSPICLKGKGIMWSFFTLAVRIDYNSKERIKKYCLSVKNGLDIHFNICYYRSHKAQARYFIDA